MSSLTPRIEYEQALRLTEERGAAISRSDSRFRRMLDRLDVLLTVPHGAPGNDPAGPPVGLSIDERLTADGAKSLILLSTCCRYTVCDMNRPESRPTPFRAAVRDEILLRKPRFLFDVHSFPDSYEIYRGRDVVLIHTPGVTDRKFLDHYALLFKIAAARLGKKLACEVQGQHQPVVHDIITEARELGMKANTVALIENNESSDPDLLGRCHALVIRSLLK